MAPEEIYKNICSELHQENRPLLKIVSPSLLPKGILGQYDFKKRTIFISNDSSDIEAARIILHELTHEYMSKVGYTPLGHGGPFLATYQLLLNMFELENDSVEQCACDNWNKRVNWPVWYNHILTANTFIERYKNENPNWSTTAPNVIASWMWNNWPRSRWVPHCYIGNYIVKNYHTYISELRGRWLLLSLLSFWMLFGGIFLVALSLRFGNRTILTFGVLCVCISALLKYFVDLVLKIKRYFPA